jgi:hypothetical protein
MLNELRRSTTNLEWLSPAIFTIAVRWVLILGTLSMVAILPWMASGNQATLLILAPLAVGAILLFLKWPPLGLIATVLGGMLIPFRGPSNLNIGMIIVALLLGLWLLEMILHRRKIALVPSATTLPLIALIVVGLLSFGFGQLPWFIFAESAPLGAQLASLALLILSAGTFLLAGNQIKDVRWLQAIVWSFLAAGAVYVLGRFIPELGTYTTWRIFQRGMEGSLFWVWLVVLAFSQGVFNRDLHPGWRAALIGLVAVTIYVAYFQSYGWKSGWIPSLIGIAAVLVAYSWRLGMAFSPFAAIAGLYVLDKAIASDAYSYETRIDAWVILADIIRESPVMGMGFANYRWFTPLFPIRGYAVYFNSHNQYVDIVAQMGIIGLLCFIWFFARVGILGWQQRTRVPAGFQQAYVYGALGGLVATLAAGMLGDWILPFFYNITLGGFRASVLAWIFLGGLVMLEQINRKSADASRTESEIQT